MAQASASALPTPLVFPIPVGPQSLTRYLKKWQQAESHLSQPRVLLMGLCGSLTPRYSVGNIVLCQNCVYLSDASMLQTDSDPELTTQLSQDLRGKANLVQVLTSDRLIWSAQEKNHLGQKYGAEAVDMEGFAALDVLGQAGIAVAMLRVVSDDSKHDLPNLNSALSPDGVLQSLPLAIGMLRQPIAATRLIKGALQGLQVLQKVTTYLFRVREGA